MPPGFEKLVDFQKRGFLTKILNFLKLCSPVAVFCKDVNKKVVLHDLSYRLISNLQQNDAKNWSQGRHKVTGFYQKIENFQNFYLKFEI